MEWGPTWRLHGIMTLTMKILNTNNMVIWERMRLAKMAKARKKLQGRTISFLIEDFLTFSFAYSFVQFVKTTTEFLSLFKTVGIVPVEKHVVILMDR